LPLAFQPCFVFWILDSFLSFGVALLAHEVFFCYQSVLYCYY
jgi:hypothetical protein